MINDFHSMRNINRCLFDTPLDANALGEYDSDAAREIREAAKQLTHARSHDDATARQAADNHARHAAAHLLHGAGASVSVRFALMLTARMVELEADALLAGENDNLPRTA
ncbi:hypothetical protein OHS70_33960 [Streptomyces sp. NBC_00390]|uniref:hypothetical protein n=1 Tax=Streptomyces sp. NBC_00390 TaxID=2975736 RepID=UPI002E1D7E74